MARIVNFDHDQIRHETTIVRKGALVTVESASKTFFAAFIPIMDIYTAHIQVAATVATELTDIGVTAMKIAKKAGVDAGFDRCLTEFEAATKHFEDVTGQTAKKQKEEENKRAEAAAKKKAGNGSPKSSPN